jgi:hypothetical protein
LYYDSFDGRSTSGTFGTASDGNAWVDSPPGTGVLTVDGGSAVGDWRSASGYTATQGYLNHPNLLNSKLLMKARWSALEASLALYGRMRISGAMYAKGIQVQVVADGSVDMLTSGWRNGSWDWGSWQYGILGAGTLTVADALWVEVLLYGTSPYTMEARVWKDGTSRPASAQVTQSASDPDYESAGKSGLWFGGGSSLPGFVYVDQLEVWEYTVGVDAPMPYVGGGYYA